MHCAGKTLNNASLADALMTEHEALTKWDGVYELVDWSRIDTLLSGIHSKARGEPAWPR